MDFTIEVTNDPNGGTAADICGYDFVPFDASETRVYLCQLILIGRYVRIFFDPGRTEFLTLCEVQVQGSKSIFVILFFGVGCPRNQR